MGNTYHEIAVFLKYHSIFEIPRKAIFFEIFLNWFKCTNYSLYDMIFFLQKYNWKYHLSAVLGTVIKCPKGTGNAWEKTPTKSCVFYKQYICSTVCEAKPAKSLLS